MARYVSSSSRTPLKDEMEARLLSETSAQPHNTKAKKKYPDYVGKKARQKAQKQLRKFRNTAALGGKAFYQDLKSWLKAPLHKTNVQPSPESAAAVLPHFCGNPPVDEEESRRLSNQQIHATRARAPAPTWQAFQKAMRRKVNKATGKDGVPPGLLRHLPKQV